MHLESLKALIRCWTLNIRPSCGLETAILNRKQKYRFGLI